MIHDQLASLVMEEIRDLDQAVIRLRKLAAQAPQHSLEAFRIDQGASHCRNAATELRRVIYGNRLKFGDEEAA